MQDFIASLLQQKFPFVLFRFPQEEEIHCFYQKDEREYTTRDFTEEGFVFAPFVVQQEKLMIPRTHHKVFTLPPISLQQSSVKLPLVNQTTFTQEVANAVTQIDKGLLEKVVLSNAFTIPYTGKGTSIFSRLATYYSNAFVSYWYHPKTGQWLGASPERLITLRAGQLSTVALAGTLGAGATKADWTPKEIHEQQLVVESIVNELRQSGAVDNIKIGERSTIQAGKLQHLQTPISATIEAGQLFNLVNYLHPTPAVGGFPKSDATNYILAHEGYNREYYTGYLGPFSKGESANFFVNLRCGKITGQQLTIYTGAGITRGSIPTNEWDEICRKASTFLGAM